MSDIDSMWQKIPCTKFDLQLKFTLNGGQCFRWKSSGKENEWIGIFSNYVWKLSQNDTHLLYQSIAKYQDENSTTLSHEELLKKYFRLEINLSDQYKDWSSRDDYFKKVAETVHGVRILAQDPIENIFSFICSANNNISRITSMVERMCSLYGTEIAQFDGIQYYTFPKIEDLAGPTVENDLRKAGFGYRAKFINESARLIVKMGGVDWINSLKKKSYQDAKDELIKLPGIGAKVADCICLMSLGHLEATPIDTHIFQIVSQRYMPHLKTCKSLTSRVYNEIVDHSQKQFGPLAGWAHTVLFCSDLKMFKENSSNENEDEPKTKKKKKK